MIAALERGRGAAQPAPRFPTWRVPAVGRTTVFVEARARSVVSATSPGPDRPEGSDHVDPPLPKRHPAARHDDPQRLPDDPLGGFELLNRLDPYDPYDRFDRLVIDAGPDDPGQDDLVDSFAAAVDAGGGTCHRVTDDVPDSLLDRLVADLDAWDIVFSGGTEESELAQRLRHRGAEVSPATPERAVGARLGLTLAIAAIADRGMVVLDTSHQRGRLASLLPPVQLCVVPAERLVATWTDALHQLGEGDPSRLPASLTVVACPGEADTSGPPPARRTHRPAALHVVVVLRGCP